MEFNTVFYIMIAVAGVLLILAIVLVVLSISRRDKNIQSDETPVIPENGDVPVQQTAVPPMAQPQPAVPSEVAVIAQNGNVPPSDCRVDEADMVRTEELSDEPAGNFVIVKKVIVTDTNEIIQKRTN